MAKLSEVLLRKQSKTYFSIEDEAVFYNKNVKLIPAGRSFVVYRNARTPFEIIRANIVIRGVINKKAIEKELKKRLLLLKLNKTTIKETVDVIHSIANSLPMYIDKQGHKIVIPFFPIHLNDAYRLRVDNLMRDPYKKLYKNYISSSVDPFDYYGPDIYDSEFTKLIKIDSNDEVTAFYDYNSQTLFFIDEQGRLENSFALFDKDLSNQDKDNMIPRLKQVVKAYFKQNREEIIKNLVTNKLVSSKTIQEFVDSEKKERYDRLKD